MKKKSVKNIIPYLKNQLQGCNLPPEAAWWLLETATGKTKTQLILEKNPVPSTQVQKKLDTWLREITQENKPLQYVLGSVPFLGLTLTVQEPILIPRPETEEWVGWLIKQLRNVSSSNLRILDIGTGTGCIALALAQALPQAEVVATDINPQAINVARLNAQQNNLTNVNFVHSDLFAALKDQKFHLIVSNPPYISDQEISLVDTSVYHWEDHQALFAAEHGTALLKKIITQAPHFLIPHPDLKKKKLPNLIVEIGFQQGLFVAQIMKASHYQEVIVYPDEAGKDRIVVGSINYEKAEP